MPQLRILHISDLHAGKPGPESLWRQRRVLGDAWLRNLETIAGGGRPVDLVCFTGDVAFPAQPEQYAQAAEFVRDLLGRLGLGPDRFFPVPGNHDVDRSVEEKAWKKLREALEPGDAERLPEAEKIRSWLSGLADRRHS
jgi:3',5'-cyclic AMP phosphodiesterase CpdA